MLAQTALSMIRKEIKYGVPQRSVLRPLFWNTAFDNILKEYFLPRACIICYADDTLVLMALDGMPILEQKINIALDAMTHWIESAGLNIPTTKTKVVLFIRHRGFSPLSFRLRGIRGKALLGPRSVSIAFVNFQS